MNAAQNAFQQGDYPQAEKLFLTAVTEAEKLGKNDPLLSISLNDLALVYRAQKKYAEAEPLYQRALAIDERNHGADHYGVAADLNSLGALYRAWGKYAEAEPLQQRSLAIWEKALGPEHPNVATGLESYAVLLRKMGREDEAEIMKARAQVIRAKHAQENPQE